MPCVEVSPRPAPPPPPTVTAPGLALKHAPPFPPQAEDPPVPPFATTEPSVKLADNILIVPPAPPPPAPPAPPAPPPAATRLPLPDTFDALAPFVPAWP